MYMLFRYNIKCLSFIMQLEYAELLGESPPLPQESSEKKRSRKLVMKQLRDNAHAHVIGRQNVLYLALCGSFGASVIFLGLANARFSPVSATKKRCNRTMAQKHCEIHWKSIESTDRSIKKLLQE
jgi:hypothetical protein